PIFPCGIFNLNGTLVFEAIYNKTDSKNGSTKRILRFLPEQVSRIVYIYLAYIRPVIVLQRKAHSQAPPSFHLFASPTRPGYRWQTKDLSKALSIQSDKYIGEKLQVRSYRHIAIGFMTQFLSSASAEILNLQNFEKHDRARTVSDQQAGHSTST